MRSEGHAGLWPHFIAKPEEYPWRFDRLEAMRDTIRRDSDGKIVTWTNPEGMKEPLPMPPLEQLECLYQRLGVGTRPTFGGLGRWTYWHAWRDGRRYSCPNAACLAALKAWVPARTDKVIEGSGDVIDLPSAYPSRFRVHPVGTSARIVSEPPDGQLWTWFALCRVYVPHELPLGPFKVVKDERGHAESTRDPVAALRRTGGSVCQDGELRGCTVLPGAPGRDRRGPESPEGLHRSQWPTEPGEYDAWLWREQAYDCREAGVDVEVQHGWGWESYTTDNAAWVDRMLFERDTVPGGRSGLLGTIVKSATNAAIGYQGIGNRYTPRVAAGRGERPGVQAGRLADWDYGEERIGRATMLHWERYTEMLVARDLYRAALPYAERGRLLRLWFDEMEVAA